MPNPPAKLAAGMDVDGAWRGARANAAVSMLISALAVQQLYLNYPQLGSSATSALIGDSGLKATRLG